MNTRRYPRTLEEAFGPYAGRTIEDTSAPRWTPWRAVLAVVYAITLLSFAWAVLR